MQNFRVYLSKNTQKSKYLAEKKKKRKRLGRGTLNTCTKLQGLISQKRRGHWTLKKFGVMCLDQSVCCLLLPLCACITHRKLFYGVANMIQHCSSRTSRSSFCDSYERCFYMCVRVHVCGRAILNEGRFQPTLPLISKAPAQHGSGTTA